MKYLKLSSILTLFFKTSILFTSTSWQTIYLLASLFPVLLPEAVKNKEHYRLLHKQKKEIFELTL